MAGKRFYEPQSGDLALWKDPGLYVKVDLEAELAALEELIALSPEARALANGELDREDWDEWSDQQRTRLKDLIDFFDYENKNLSLNVKDGADFTPVAVESFCGEEVGQEADLTIDGLNNTFWEHREDHVHDIVWQLRDYKKRMESLEVRIGSSVRNLLTGVDIYIADNIPALSQPNRLVASGVDFVVPNSWETVDFGSKWNGKWIRFANFGSQHASNEIRIQEIKVRVVTVEYD